ncbi:hypothetical protein H257_01643 [Aphanomyces astaci]|uniref:USP domain-containing protein n=1 Tax=Aphanomyces astaci TaxID=112090 RepID=W4H3G7_APHAT|nr:hypothetical protein H257_01643 [Aphanomyces astaci]ETV86447.1 hypothetical protein H257_01643 [Aphanomyces astaci]|eukprot:XP_009823246.1 hypothetical protein H257_01643 [Aphanomyces astaci]
MTDRATLLKHTSMHKGLTNYVGQNNCFLNVIIQSLWHLDSFRVLITSSDHTALHSVHDTCLLCELKEIFTYYEYGEEKTLAPDNVRVALNVLSSQTDRFRLGAMADATETLDMILASMHADQVRHHALPHPTPTTPLPPQQSLSSSIEINDTDCDPKCIGHALFESNMFDMYRCQSCQATSEPEMWKDTLYRVYFAELYQCVANTTTSAKSFFFRSSSPTANHPSNKENSFEAVLRTLLNEGPRRSCPENELTKCRGSCLVDRWLMKFPIVFAVSIVWPATTVGGVELKAFANIIPHQLDLGLIFRLGGDAADLPKPESIYVFRGMVCYYGQHYVSFFKSQSKAHEWYLFDDVQVHKIGSWDEVRRRIERGCYQPTILFWEKNQLKFDQLETLAQHVHLPPPTSPRSPAKRPQEQPSPSSLVPVLPVVVHPPAKPSPPKPSRPTLACHVFTTNVAPRSPTLLPDQAASLDALDTLDEIDIGLQSSSKSGTRLSFTAPLPSLHRTPTSPLASHPSWEVLRAPVASSPDGKCRYIVRLTAQDGGLGLVVGDDISSLEPPSESSSDPHPPRRLMITALETSNSKRPLLPAVACGVICVGDQLLQMDGEVVEDESWTAWTAMERLVTASGPVTLTFARAVPWSCSHCTLINDVGATTCAACDRPHLQLPSSGAASSVAPNEASQKQQHTPAAAATADVFV